MYIPVKYTYLLGCSKVVYMLLEIKMYEIGKRYKCTRLL